MRFDPIQNSQRPVYSNQPPAGAPEGRIQTDEADHTGFDVRQLNGVERFRTSPAVDQSVSLLCRVIEARRSGADAKSALSKGFQEQFQIGGLNLTGAEDLDALADAVLEDPILSALIARGESSFIASADTGNRERSVPTNEQGET